MDTKTPGNTKNSPRLKVLIIILSVLLVLSAGGIVGNNETGLHGSGTGASGTDAEQSADGTDGNTLSPVPDAGQNAGQDGEQDTEQNAVQDGQNDPADDADEPEDGTNAGSDTADDDTANGGTADGNTTDVGTGTGGQSDGADA